MSQIFGGSQAQSSQSNQAYPTLSSSLGSNLTNGAAAGSQIANMLGLNGTQSQNNGFQNFQNSTGYQFGLNQGVGAITGNAATQGLLNSGSTAKAVDTYGQNYANTQYGNYMGQLQSLLTGGNQSGSVIGGAGNVANSSSSSITSPFGSQGGGTAISSGIGQLLAKG